MNNQRRKKLKTVVEALRIALQAVEAVRDEEQDALNNLPEGLQNSQKGEAMQEAIDNLETIYDGIETAIDELSELTGS